MSMSIVRDTIPPLDYSYCPDCQSVYIASMPCASMRNPLRLRLRRGA